MTIEEKIAVRITPTKNGPYKVEFLDNLSNRHGPLEVKETMYLCRCGGSSNKPFCDRTHLKNGFNSAKLDERVEDKRDNYEGKEVTIHDNRGICAHIGFCTDELPAVFRQGQEPWVDPDGASGDRIVAQVRRCPSGALSYSVDNIEHRDREGEPSIFVSHNGPYFVTGRPLLVETDRGEGASTEHFALCRCGGSKNKPFCDGTHWYINFTDDKN
jgi:CDGSH-type Zn-finger protein